MNINKHKSILVRLLKDIYSDIEIAPLLGFKGGTALMFFYGLPRFSVDLDFNLLNLEKEIHVFERARSIIEKYGRIHDEAQKFYSSILVLDYGTGERKLKIEISKRDFADRYEVKNWLGISMKVMVIEDMFAHKLCALLDRRLLAHRDIFDVWFFMDRQTPLNKLIVEKRMGLPLDDYLQKCIDMLTKKPDKGLLQGMGDLMDDDLKSFVRTKLRADTIRLLKLYKQYPILP